MEELKLHAEGQKDHLASLKEKYESSKNTIQKSFELTKGEKKVELKKIKVLFSKKSKDSDQNFY